MLSVHNLLIHAQISVTPKVAHVPSIKEIVQVVCLYKYIRLGLKFLHDIICCDSLIEVLALEVGARGGRRDPSLLR